MLLIRTYEFFCPNCNQRFARSLSPMLLGPGRRKCRHCGLLFADGSQEWPALSSSDKFRFLFPVTILGGILGVIGFAVASRYAVNDEDNWIRWLTLEIMAAPFVPYFLLRWFQVHRSRRRYCEAMRAHLGLPPAIR